MSKHKKSDSTSTDSLKKMNESLKEWLSSKDQEIISKAIQDQLHDRKPEGICQVCGVNTAKAVCIKCKKSICTSCYFTMVGLCKNCLSKETVDSWKTQKPNIKKILEVDWVD